MRRLPAGLLAVISGAVGAGRARTFDSRIRGGGDPMRISQECRLAAACLAVRPSAAHAGSMVTPLEEGRSTSRIQTGATFDLNIVLTFRRRRPAQLDALSAHLPNCEPAIRQLGAYTPRAQVRDIVQGVPGYERSARLRDIDRVENF